MVPDEEKPAEGVYYARRDYAGLGRRLLILTVDGLVLWLVLIAELTSYLLLGVKSPWSFHLHALVFVMFSFLYLAVLGRSDAGTIGYALTSVRVVTLGGQRPSLACMIYRTLFAVLGPLNALLDLIWVTGDPDRQSLRDKLAGTYVIRRGAMPSGAGPQRLVVLSLLGWSLMVREVGRKGT